MSHEEDKLIYKMDKYQSPSKPKLFKLLKEDVVDIQIENPV